MVIKYFLRVLTLCAFVAAGISGRHSGAGAAEQATPLRTFFSFEREIWMETSNADLILQAPQRCDVNPVLRRGEGAAIDAHRIDFTSILPDGRRLLAWYGAIRKQQPGRRLDLRADLAVALAESQNGLHWTKPSLDAAGTNVVIPGAAYMTVARGPANGKDYRGIVAFFRDDVGKPGAESGATFEFVRSQDGVRWDFSRKPSTAVRHFEAYGLYQRDGRWWILGQGVPPYVDRPEGLAKRVMYGFHGEDEKNFALYPRPLLAYPGNRFFPDASPQTHVGAGVWDRGRVLLGLSGQFWPGGFSATVAYSIGLIYSRDGINWTEPFPRTPILMPGPSGSWDRGWVLQVQRPVSKGDRTFVFYVGADGGNEWSAHADLGLALLRRDGFAAWVARNERGELITRPLEVLRGETKLYLNARGPISVEVLDQYLRPAGARADLKIDGVREPVLDLQGLRPPENFRLRFGLLPGAELYSFSFGPSSSLPSLSDWE